MILKPRDWNTVIVGNWNPAILTPKGISRLLFDKPDNLPLEIMVPVNGIGPTHVKIDDLIVMSNFDQLIIGTTKTEWTLLDNARKVALRAIEQLPKTPLTAAGYNIRYSLESSSVEFLQLLNANIDESLTNAAFNISQKEIKRTIQYNKGDINLDILNTISNNYVININFDRSSNQIEDLNEWLNIGISEIENTVNKILYEVLKIEKEVMQS